MAKRRQAISKTLAPTGGFRGEKFYGISAN
jgi:hypothetical protein